MPSWLVNGWWWVSDSSERELAARLLVRIDDGAFAGPLLERVPGAPVRVRVLGVLRWRLLLDSALERFSRRPLSSLDPEVLAVLRLGLFEGALLGVPPAVAVDSAVHLVRRVGKGSASGLVNAVLRRAVPEARRLRREAPLHIRWSHPHSIVNRWRNSLGEKELARILELDQEPAGLWIWFSDEDLRRKLEEAGAVRRHEWLAGGFVAEGDPSPVLSALAAGSAYAQDPASQLAGHVAAVLAEGVPPGPIVDLCAAPGGKSALLLQRGPQRPLVALDLHLSRVRLVSGLLERGSGKWLAAAADGVKAPLSAESSALVVLDAPCSGSGTLRRHPEIRWRFDENHLRDLKNLQVSLLRVGLDLLVPGGVVLYSTCSLEPEENEEVIRSVDRPQEVRVEPIRHLVPEGAPAQELPTGGVRLLPGESNDGFTLHALRRS